MKRLFSGFGGLSLSRLSPQHRSDLSDSLPTILTSAVLLVVFASLYLFRLGSFVPAGGGEIHAIQAANSTYDVLHNPLLLPFKLVAFVFMQLPVSDLLAVRLASVSVAFMSGILFFILACRWYGRLTGGIDGLRRLGNDHIDIGLDEFGSE